MKFEQDSNHLNSIKVLAQPTLTPGLPLKARPDVGNQNLCTFVEGHIFVGKRPLVLEVGECCSNHQ